MAGPCGFSGAQGHSTEEYEGQNARRWPQIHKTELLPGLPGGEGVTSAAGEVPNSREMILRRWAGAGAGAGAEGCTEEDTASKGGTGDGAEGQVAETPRDS